MLVSLDLILYSPVFIRGQVSTLDCITEQSLFQLVIQELLSCNKAILIVISAILCAGQYVLLKYRSTSLYQTCLSRIHGICRSDHPFLSIFPILLCISNLFMSNLVVTKSRLYRSGFSFPKISFPLLYYYLCGSKFCAGQNIKQYECQAK